MSVSVLELPLDIWNFRTAEFSFSPGRRVEPNLRNPEGDAFAGLSMSGRMAAEGTVAASRGLQLTTMDFVRTSERCRPRGQGNDADHSAVSASSSCLPPV